MYYVGILEHVICYICGLGAFVFKPASVFGGTPTYSTLWQKRPRPCQSQKETLDAKIEPSQVFHDPFYRETVHWISPFGVDCGAYTSASLPVFLRPLCQLRSNAVLDGFYSSQYFRGTYQSQNSVY